LSGLRVGKGQPDRAKLTVESKKEVNLHLKLDKEVSYSHEMMFAFNNGVSWRGDFERSWD